MTARPPQPPSRRPPAPSPARASSHAAPAPSPAAAAPLGEADVHRLQVLMDKLPEPLEPFDVSMLDGYLCGVLLQPEPVPAGAWLKHVFDIDGRPVPAGTPGINELQGLVQRRYRELNAAIAGRQWFDPWVFELDDEATPQESMLPWAAGFSTALELFPTLMNRNDPEALEPMAVLYAAFDPEDLEDADALLEMIESLEPPSNLDEAVEDIVQSVLRLADVSRPQKAGAGAPRRPPPRRPQR